ncbi:glycosyl transferase family 2 [Methylotenera oryzisoli]|uniref:Glycosyl transferase family 2 n=1 Tax=Methylotenera oryzisoli TaxID=2080758 RepID=A0A4Y9VRK4_9PROT|nr:glycosyltransferase [Methylotenera oryzisoli]TFW71655.1 glycosyl transferase family 2 [Methylotenera oryzisoli]
MMKSNVKVLLATFNGGDWVASQIDSILNQSGVDVVVNVSDDGSTDGTQQLLNNYAGIKVDLVLLPTKKNGSASANFFRLLRDTDLTYIDYVALSDQDDVWQEDKLGSAIQVIVKNNIAAYSSSVLAFWPNGKQKLINKAQPQQQYDYMFESAGPGCTFVLTKKLALELQSFLIENEEKCQLVALHDWFIYAYARSSGYKWFIDPRPHMLYRQHAENVVGANVGLKAKLARWKKLRDGWLVEQALLIANILGYSNALPIQKLVRYNLADRLWLILNVTKLRRRLRDRVALALFLILPLKR